MKIKKGGSFILNRNTAHTSTKTAQFSKKVLKICTAHTLYTGILLLLLSASAASAATITADDSDGVVDECDCTYLARAIAGVPGCGL